MPNSKEPLLLPTLRLPDIRKIQYSDAAVLTSAIEYLSNIYNPEVCGIQYISRRSCPLDRFSASSAPRRKSNASIVQNADAFELDSLRADSFERAYSMRWLTVLASQTEHLSSEGSNWESVVQNAAHLLAICAGAASAGARSRTFVFSGAASEKLSKMRVQITDLPLDNQDYSSVGAQTWGGACLLADMIVKSPKAFGIVVPPTDSPERSLRILELGAGTGLVGIAVGKVLQACAIPSEVILTDFYPSVLENLRHNIAANIPTTDSSVTLASHLDWSTFPASYADGTCDPLFSDVFDLIFGADIIYELEHARWIKSCVEILLRKPSKSQVEESTASAKNPCFHLVIPLRTTHTAESHTVEEVFPFAPATQPSSSPILAIAAKEVIVCGDIWSDGSREVQYVHYSICWV